MVSHASESAQRLHPANKGLRPILLKSFRIDLSTSPSCSYLPDALLQANQHRADFHCDTGGLHSCCQSRERRPSMENGDNAWHWQQRIADVLIAAATVAVALAATGATTEISYMLLIAVTLIGIGLVLEPKVTPQHAGDIAPQPLRPMELKTARPEPQLMGRFDAPIVDATSV